MNTTIDIPVYEDNSRPLDVHRWSDHPEVNSFVKKLWDDEFAQEFEPRGRGNRPKQKLKYQFKVLILDLYVAWKQDPTLRLGVGMAERFYNASSRYNELHISSKMIGLVNSLYEHGYIDKKTGSQISVKVTRIWPTPKLIDLFMKARFSEYDMGISDEIEVIILNNKDDDTKTAKPKEYKDSDYAPIPQMRLDLQRYNALLKDTFVDMGSLESPVIKKEYWDTRTNQYRYHKVFIRQNNKLVRRIFYRGKWEFGGRCHGGWWQQIPSSHRYDIFINDERTLEVDYSGLHISLIYCIEGQNPPRDPYTLPPLLTDYETHEQRKIVKGLVLCAINADSRTTAFRAFRHMQEGGSKEKNLDDVDLNKLLDAFIQQNPVVEEYIARDKGVELMKLDGKITAYIINHFTKKNIPVLSIHDSFIVPEGESDEVLRVMRKAVSELIGDYEIRATHAAATLPMLLMFAKQDPFERHWYYQQIEKRYNHVKSDGYIKRRDEFYEWKNNRDNLL